MAQFPVRAADARSRQVPDRISGAFAPYSQGWLLSPVPMELQHDPGMWVAPSANSDALFSKVPPGAVVSAKSRFERSPAVKWRREQEQFVSALKRRSATQDRLDQPWKGGTTFLGRLYNLANILREIERKHGQREA